MTSLEAVQPRPRDVVLQQYMDHHASDFQRNPYWHSPDHWYRWLVLLDCGCVTEVLTFGDDSPPTEHRYHPSKVLGDPPLNQQTWILHPDRMRGECIFEGAKNPFPNGCCQPSGHIWCAAHDDETPWRDVEQWIGRKTHYDKETGKPYASWSVRLSCGHCHSSVTSDIDWSPETPPHVDLEKVENIKENLSEEHKDISDKTRRFLSEQIEHKGFLVSSPATAEKCPKCVYLRAITEYQLIGRLSDQPMTAPPKKPQPTAKELADKKRRRLRRVESDLARLQQEAERLRDELENDGEAT